MRAASWGVPFGMAAVLCSTAISNAGGAEPVAPARLASDRLRALRQAVQVDDLSRAYRVDTAVASGDRQAEPGRFVVQANARPLAAAPPMTASASIPTAAPSAGMKPRRDEAVRPAVWVGDQSTPVIGVGAESSNDANPLRNALHAGAAGATANPLR